MDAQLTPKNTEEVPEKKSCVQYGTGSVAICVMAVAGIILGICLQQAEPSDELISWLQLPGTLFIRALKCLVAPLVFCSLVTGMADMLNVGKASSIGWRTAVAYTVTTVIASIEGLIMVVIFRPLFSSAKDIVEENPILVGLQCPNGQFAGSSSTDQSIVCNHTNITATSTFELKDIKQILTISGATVYEKLSLSEAFQAQLKQMVPDNIFRAFSDGNLLSIVMFAIPFGIAVSMLPKDKAGSNHILNLFRLFNKVFMNLVTYAIAFTPIAVFCLITGALASNDNLGDLLKDVGTFLATVFIGLVIHTAITLPAIFFAIIKENPFIYLKFIYPAQVFALGCASSMATLPVTMKCVDSTKEVSKALSRFVLSLGATINMDGSALYYPAAIVFMAEVAGYGHRVGAVEMFMIIIVSTIGAVGSAPVPAAGMVMIVTIWNSIFPTIPLPEASFAYIVATDWITDRCITAVNVTGDTIITRIIAHLVSEDKLEQERTVLAAVYDDGFLIDKEEVAEELRNEVAEASDTTI